MPKFSRYSYRVLIQIGCKPAGRHGFMTCRDGRLVFEDGAEARFWGANFNSAANFPPHHYSEKVARRLAKFGVNLVRFKSGTRPQNAPGALLVRTSPSRLRGSRCPFGTQGRPVSGRFQGQVLPILAENPKVTAR